MLFIVIVSNFSVNDLRVTPYEMWFSLLVPVSKFRWILFPTFRNHGEFFYMSADIRLSSLLVYWFFVFWKIYFFLLKQEVELKNHKQNPFGIVLKLFTQFCCQENVFIGNNAHTYKFVGILTLLQNIIDTKCFNYY